MFQVTTATCDMSRMPP